MNLETIGRDCLFLNWALPLEVAPELEAPLRYDLHRWQGEDHVFLSVALFRQQVLDIPKVIFPRVSYPQLVVRLCTTDADRVPSFFLCSLLLPAWVLPSVRLVARQQARKASFDYPPQGAGLVEQPQRWCVRSGDSLEVIASTGTGITGQGPSLGNWRQSVAYFERRERWYFSTADGLRHVEVSNRDVESVPASAEIADHSLLSSCLADIGGRDWPELHSCWLSPEIPLVFEVGWAKERRLPRHLPAPG